MRAAMDEQVRQGVPAAKPYLRLSIPLPLEARYWYKNSPESPAGWDTGRRLSRTQESNRLRRRRRIVAPLRKTCSNHHPRR
jgi:hypothetical protein